MRSLLGRLAPHRIAFACAAIALAVSGGAVIASIAPYGWSSTVLVRMSAGEPLGAIAVRADPDFRFVAPTAHYDGVYFYAIARDPLARERHPLIDRPGYRYGHPGYGWLAWLLSLGRTAAIPAALLTIGLASVAVAAFAASLIATDHGWSPWGGLVAVAFNPGVVYSITADTSEPLALALTLLALLAWARRRLVLAGIALVAACLTKEPLVLVPVGLALWEVVEALRGRRAPDLFRRLAVLAAGPLAFGLWYGYLRAVFGHFPSTEARDLTSSPVHGWLEAFRMAARFASGDFNAAQIGAVAVPLLAVVGGLILLALVLSFRVRTEIDPVYLLLALVAFSLSWWGVLFPKDLIREVTLPLALAPAVFAGALRPPPRDLTG